MAATAGAVDDGHGREWQMHAVLKPAFRRWTPTEEL
jgi:hypothetical protein